MFLVLFFCAAVLTFVPLFAVKFIILHIFSFTAFSILYCLPLAFFLTARTKTPIENHFWKQLGAQVNSMSIGPESVLANELQIPVAAMLIGHKYSLPKSEKRSHTHQSIEESLQKSKQVSEKIIWDFLRSPPQISFANHIYKFS